MGGGTGAVAMGGGTITGGPPMGVAGAPGFCMCKGGGMAGGLGCRGGCGGKLWAAAVSPFPHFGWASMFRKACGPLSMFRYAA